jgi:alkanesulfonate monooxygenase SsuD/methylene tetrahydromethanopterin reductase-like flavin-dependent oxidoreductase (luciferase family)
LGNWSSFAEGARARPFARLGIHSNPLEEILKRCWAEERFSFEGKFHRFHNVTIVPRPLQKPYPPLRIAATSPDTYRVIGAMGLPIFVAVRLGTFEELGPSIAALTKSIVQEL